MLKNYLRIIPELSLDKDKTFSFTDKYTKEGQTLDITKARYKSIDITDIIKKLLMWQFGIKK